MIHFGKAGAERKRLSKPHQNINKMCEVPARKIEILVLSLSWIFITIEYNKN